MQWLELILKALPVTVAGVEYLYHEADSTTKQQLAKDSLGVASAVASSFLPEDQAKMAQAAAAASGGLIDGVVNIFNQAGVFQHKATA